MDDTPEHDEQPAILDDVICEAFRILPDAASRLLFNCQMDNTWLEPFAPSPEERLPFDMGMQPENKEIARQYFEEITVLERVMEEKGIPAVDGKRNPDDFMGELREPMARRNIALTLWKLYAIPWRIDGANTHLIFPSRVLMGSPVIHTYPTYQFIWTLSLNLRNTLDELEDAKKQPRLLKRFGIFKSKQEERPQ